MKSPGCLKASGAFAFYIGVCCDVSPRDQRRDAGADTTCIFSAERSGDGECTQKHVSPFDQGKHARWKEGPKHLVRGLVIAPRTRWLLPARPSACLPVPFCLVAPSLVIKALPDGFFLLQICKSDMGYGSQVQRLLARLSARRINVMASLR